ncbi:MAG: glycosyltransferase family 2 protein [Solirubrobacterales bacterium]
MPRVSVIIPAFNAEAVLPQALRSIRQQSFGDWEAIVSDDASTDRTAEIAGEFGERVRVVRSQRNRGPAAARNAGIEDSSGELLAFLDADDYWLPEFLSEQVRLYDRDRGESEAAGLGIVACDALILGEGGMARGTYRDRIPFDEPLTLPVLLKRNPIFISALVPRTAVEQVGRFSPECFGTEDYDLWIRLLEVGCRVAYNPRPLAVYRLAGAGSVSGDTARMARNTQVVYRRALERGRLSRHERRIASRELRVQELAERLAALGRNRSSGPDPSARDLLGILPQAIRFALENPRRLGPIAARVVRGRGPIQDRILPGRDWLTLEPDSEATETGRGPDSGDAP